MNYNTLFAALAKLGLIEKERAKALAHELTHSIQPARYEDAETLVDKVFKEVDK